MNSIFKYTFIVLLFLIFRIILIPFLYEYSEKSNFRKLINLTNREGCINLNKQLNYLISPNTKDWSITVINSRANALANINGRIPRIPASNLKLVTTAYSIDKLDVNANLTTNATLYDDRFIVTSDGDPDFSLYDLNNLAKSISTHSIKAKSPIQILFNESRINNWWPKGWTEQDKRYAYGSPITKYAINSNSLNDFANDSPYEYFVNSLQDKLSKYNRFDYRFINTSQPTFTFLASKKLIYSKSSAPFYALLTLANSESHNFTSEVLLRKASASWNLNQSINSLRKWIRYSNLPLDQIQIFDGSGLSRRNRLTTEFLSQLLLKMSKHPDYIYYKSSMSVLGVRGTLSSIESSPAIKGRFYGKTGTLKNVRSLSGILETKTGNLYISLITNNLNGVDPTMVKILESINENQGCII